MRPTVASIDEKGASAGPGRCGSCGAELEAGQRYCVTCGTRRMPLPLVLSSWLDRMRSQRLQTEAKKAELSPAAGEGKVDESEKGREQDVLAAVMPTPQAVAVAVMALLAFGVILGSLTDQLAQSAGISTILLEEPPVAKEEAVPEEGEVGEPESFASAPPPSRAPAPVAALPIVPEESTGAKPPEAPKIELPPEPTLPPISHVFLIVLSGHGYEEAFGEASESPYLSRTLAAKGELLPNYYAVAPGDLANEVALLSGQGPTPQTLEDCPEYTDVVPGTVGPAEQVEGAGCIYPKVTETLAGQLTAAGDTWKAYVEGIGNGGPEQAATCRHPTLGALDPDHEPNAGDGYLTWRNPFVYFHSILDGDQCAERDVGLEGLTADLKSPSKTPALSYIVPDACHDGSDVPCEPGAAAGLAAAEPFLEEVVGEIEESQAYAASVIAITFADAPQSGPNADPSACCGTPEYPNLPPAPEAGEAPAGPTSPSGGGGRVGMLLLSPYVFPGSVAESGYYNHFSLLLSIERLFGLKPLGYAADPALSAFDETVFNAQG